MLKDLKKRTWNGLIAYYSRFGRCKKIADEVCVMSEGQIVESKPTDKLFANPEHPYTRKLIGSESGGAPNPIPNGAEKILEVDDSKSGFHKKGILKRTIGHIKAVDGISFSIRSGETLGVVGESGSGKTTLGLAALRLQASRGKIVFIKSNKRLENKNLRPFRRECKLFFRIHLGAYLQECPWPKLLVRD